MSALRSCLQQRGGTVWRAHADACLRERTVSRRLQEKYRQLVLFYEEKDGPFAVSGPELRRAASNYSWQATHSYQNGNSMPTYAQQVAAGEERALGDTRPIAFVANSAAALVGTEWNWASCVRVSAASNNVTSIKHITCCKC